jgi:hypothetical protein
MNNIFIILLIILFAGCKSSMEDKIKNDFFSNCKIVDVETLIKYNFSNPSWESFTASDGNLFILNMKGQRNGEKVLLQFQMDKNDNWFIYAYEVNSQPQNSGEIMSLIFEMCEYYKDYKKLVENASINNSYDGTYISEDNSYYIKIIIDGNTWRGESMLVTGFGYENDSQTSEYWEGTLVDNQVYIGDTNVGKVTKNFLDIQLGSEYFSLQKN